MSRLFATKAQAIAAESELDRIAQRRSADDFNIRAVAEAHLQQPATNFRIASDRDHAAGAADAELVQGAGARIATMIASGQIASLLAGSGNSFMLNFVHTSDSDHPAGTPSGRC